MPTAATLVVIMAELGTALEMKTVSKSFPGTLAVDKVNLTICAGEVHAIVGENGAGKSTLMKIIAGSFSDYTGEILINGVKAALHTPAAARAAGVAMIYQELSLAPALSVAENIMAGHLPVRYGFLDRRRLRSQARVWCDRVGLSVDPDMLVEDLSQHEAQLVEIAKALSRLPCILVMDEPTSSLSREETGRLFEIIRKLRSNGLAIVYISHHLSEIFSISDRVTVMRDGRRVDTKPTGELTQKQLIAMMVGRAGDDLYHIGNRQRIHGNVRLRVECLTRYGFFRDISFRVHEGEILGIGGLCGAGRTELARSIVGADSYDAGDLFLNELRLPRGTMTAALKAGLAYLTEERKAYGLALRLSTAENALAALIPRHSTLLHYSGRKGEQILAGLIKDLEIRPDDPAVIVRNLSGGNQQKVLLAKWLALQPQVLILDEPTRGVDIGAKVVIHKAIEDLAGNGTAVILVSSDLPELVALSDRIMIMRQGRFVGEMPREQCTEESVLLAANGGEAT